MNSLAAYLKKFKQRISNKEDEIKTVQTCVDRLFGVAIPPESITIRGATIYITGSPVFKNKIFIQKEELVKNLHEAGLAVITDVR